jgi:hypothetical protein
VWHPGGDMKRHWSIIIILITFFIKTTTPRGIHRKNDPSLAEIKTRWVGDDQEYSLKSHEFDAHTLFKLFDYDHIKENLLPEGPISYRNENKTVLGSELDAELNDLVTELKKTKRTKKEYKNFKVLKRNNFNHKKSIGALILKFKKHPFVVKLFIETPHSFVRPYFRDLEQNCLFVMGGGICRYLVGFTRIKNLHYIKQRIAADEYWSKEVDTPRKWFWLPKKNRWFELKGYNVGGIPEQHVTLPSIYATIADAIEPERVFSASNASDRRKVLSLTTWLEERLDPNIPNYMIEKATGKMVFIDSEHFPTNLGMRKRLEYDSYLTWYSSLVRKYIMENYLRTKKDRMKIRNGKMRPIMRVPEVK